MFCIGNVSLDAAGEEIFLNLTTAWSIFHIERGFISGWPICVSGDGTGKISKKQVTMIGFGINSIPAKFNTLNYCVSAVENEDIYIRAWQGVQGTFSLLWRSGNVVLWHTPHAKFAHWSLNFGTVCSSLPSLPRVQVYHATGTS